MKYIDAVWEERNLGVHTVEAVVEVGDTVDTIRDFIKNINTEYIVMKVPVGMIDIMRILEEEAFHFMETSIHVVHNLKDLKLNSLQQRIDREVSYSLMKKDDIDELFHEIKRGLFNSDRIYLDPFFSKQQAANRYLFWIQDEIERGSELYKLVYKGNNIGFFIFKYLEEGCYYPFLAGIYEAYRGTGLGFVFNYKPLCEAAKRGGKCVSTYISTNNIPAVKMHVLMGYQVDGMHYIYIKHGY